MGIKSLREIHVIWYQNKTLSQVNLSFYFCFLLLIFTLFSYLLACLIYQNIYIYIKGRIQKEKIIIIIKLILVELVFAIQVWFTNKGEKKKKNNHIDPSWISACYPSLISKKEPYFGQVSKERNILKIFQNIDYLFFNLPSIVLFVPFLIFILFHCSL